MTTRAEIVAWEVAFCPLTEDEKRLLCTPSSQMGSLESQDQFILKWYMEPAACPACLSAVPPRFALGKPVDYRAVAGSDEFTCPRCRLELERVVPLLGPCFWALARPLKTPEQAAEVTDEY